MDTQTLRSRKPDPDAKALIASFNDAGWLAVREKLPPHESDAAPVAKTFRIFTQAFRDVPGDPMLARPGDISEISYPSIDDYIATCHPDALEAVVSGPYQPTPQAQNIRAFACWTPTAGEGEGCHTYLRLCWEEVS